MDRGILPTDLSDLNKFIHPTIDNEHNPELLDHMEEGYQLLIKHLSANGRIYLVVDADADGFTSSALVYSYLTEVIKPATGWGFTIDYHIPEGKEHGLEIVMPYLSDRKRYDLIILPDSSSNNYDYHQLLSEMGYDILVLDHHEAERYSPDAVVINNQLSENYPNKALSGVGVVYKFFEYVEKKLNDAAILEGREPLGSHVQDYLDLVALGEVSDVMQMTTLENRWIVDYGLSHIKNKFFKEIIEKQEYSLKTNEKPLDQMGVAFYITPLINALIRVGSPLEKERLFQAFITPDQEVESTKRGEKGLKETIATQSVRNCINAKSRQTRERDKAAELLDIQIIENCLDENKILILNADELDTSTTLTGLCAMGVAAKYKKPVLLGRMTPDGKYLKGSIRNKDGGALRNLKTFLLSSGLMEYVEGHQEAAGFGIASSNIDKLLAYANQKLANVNFSEGLYDVDFIIRNKDFDLPALIRDLARGDKYWGQGCPQAVIAVENIKPENISVIGTNSDTLRFTYNGTTFVKFKCKDLIEELRYIKDEYFFNIVGKANINRWGGRETPQILVDELEIKVLEGF